jgi:hypothetical protein
MPTYQISWSTKAIERQHNMKSITLKYLASAAFASGLVLSTQAIPITGNITMGGGATFNTASVNNATAVTSWAANDFVKSVSGFSGVSINDLVTMGGAWTFLPAPGTAVSALWSVDGYTFDLTSDVVSQGGGFINITGVGTIRNAAYDTTAFNWNFSSQDPSANTPPVWSWSASTAEVGVPDGGTTAMLLGAALTGLGLLRRKLA